MSYTKTTWENLPSTNTPINATNLNKIENELVRIQRDIITINITSNVTISTTGETALNLSNTYLKLGDKLSLENGKVKIGTGVSKVLISAQCAVITANTRATSACNLYVYKNNSAITTSLNAGVAGGINITKNITPIPITVTSGDLISLSVYLAANDVISSLDRTYLTVEVLD